MSKLGHLLIVALALVCVTLADDSRPLGAGPHYNPPRRISAAKAKKVVKELETKIDRAKIVLDAKNDEAKKEEAAEKAEVMTPPPNEEPFLSLSTRPFPAVGALNAKSSAEDYLDFFLSADKPKVPGYCTNKLLDNLGEIDASKACEYPKEEKSNPVAIIVQNLPRGTPVEDVKRFFRTYGNVVSVAFDRSGSATVIYAAAGEATRALEEADGRTYRGVDLDVKRAPLRAPNAPAPSEPGVTDNLIYEIKVRFLPRVTMKCLWRLGAGFTNGGAVLQAGDSPITVRPNVAMDWDGTNWSSTDAIIETPRLSFAPDVWQELSFYGVVKKSNGKPFALQMDCGEGFEKVETAAVKTFQIKGWKTQHVFLPLNRGFGNPVTSVIETGYATFGRHQDGWTLVPNPTTGEVANFRRKINFGSWFPFAPEVQVFLTRLDSSPTGRTRIFARVNRITSTNFILDLGSLNSTSVFQVGVSWIAYTPTPLRGTQVSRACVIGQDTIDDWTLDAGEGHREYAQREPLDETLQLAPKNALLGFDLIEASPESVVFDTTLTSIARANVDFAISTDRNSELYAERACALVFAPREREIETGEELLNYQTAPGWTLDHGNGLREYRMFVKFKQAFEDRPDVIITVTGLELEGPTRFDAHVTLVHTNGFEVHISTWGNTEMHAIRLRWLATFAGTRYNIVRDTSSAPSNKCTCEDPSEDKRQEQLIKEKRLESKTCPCLEDTVGARKPVYMNLEDGFGGALEFSRGSPKQKPVFFAFPKPQGDKLVPLYYYTNSKHPDRLYTTKYFDPTDEWHGGSVAFYVLPQREEGSVPLYRFFDPVKGFHRYTVSTSMFERRGGMYMIKNEKQFRKEGAYRYEGIQAYVFPYLGQ